MQFLSHCVQFFFFFYFQQSLSWDSWCHQASSTNCIHHQRLKKAALLKQTKENLILKFSNSCKLSQIRSYPDRKHLKPSTERLEYHWYFSREHYWYNTHPGHNLSTLQPCGEQYRRIRCRTTRLQSSFFPQAVRLLNAASTLQLRQFVLCGIKEQNLHFIVQPCVKEQITEQ